MTSITISDFRRWLAIGTGVGVEIGAEDLRVTVARVRPSGAAVLGGATIARFHERPAGEWGAGYASFLKQLGAGHLAANVLLPRQDVIVRQLSLPGVPDRDLAAAIEFQIEPLHPYAEQDVVYSWARIRNTGTVLIGITRREVIARYVAMFAEAGIKVASFTFSAAAVYSAIRLVSTPPAGGFLAIAENDGGLEAYGESEARPVFSARLDADRERASALAAAELRLPADSPPLGLADLLPSPKPFPPDYDLSRNALAYAAALAGACSRLALPLNLLPAESRSSGSRAIFIPTAALASLLLVLGVALAAISPLEDRRYLAALDGEIAELEPQARKAAALERSIETARARVRLLDDFRRRSKADLDVLGELTRLLAPPSWLSMVEIARDSVTLAGEAEQAAGLLKVIDESPFFRNSEFTMPMARVGRNESFRIRAAREGAPQ